MGEQYIGRRKKTNICKNNTPVTACAIVYCYSIHIYIRSAITCDRIGRCKQSNIT